MINYPSYNFTLGPSLSQNLLKINKDLSGQSPYMYMSIFHFDTKFEDMLTGF